MTGKMKAFLFEMMLVAVMVIGAILVVLTMPMTFTSLQKFWIVPSIVGITIGGALFFPPMMMVALPKSAKTDWWGMSFLCIGDLCLLALIAIFVLVR